MHLPNPPLHPALSRPLSTPIKIDKFQFYLEGYPARSKQYLLNGFRFGFSIDYVGSRRNFSSKNLLSAITNPKAVDDKLDKEVVLGRIVGPFDARPFSVFHISPLGLIPKKAPGEFRLIHHLSFPEGQSVNSHIPKIASSVHYANIDDAIRLVRRTGRGCALAKTDIKNAFRLIPVSPSDYNLLGICWRDKFYVDRNLAMGLSSSCKIFECFSSALEWIARVKLNITGILHLLDDFLLVSKSLSSCADNLRAFLQTCDDIGVPMAPEKTVGPSFVLSFAGIELDTINMEARLPDDKLAKCRSLIREFLPRKKVTLTELQSLIGLLNFTCSVIVPGRTFLRRLINLTVGVTRPRYFIRLNRETKADLRLWLNFLESYNGKSFFLDYIWLSSAKLHLYTDASGSLGYGAVFGAHWFYGPWPISWLGRNIIVLEMFPIVISVSIWASDLANKCILFHTDNQGLVEVINKKTTKDRQLLVLLRELVLQCLKHNILFRAVHVPGVHNVKADALSRLQVTRFKSLDQGMDHAQTIVPAHLLPQNWPL